MGFIRTAAVSLVTAMLGFSMIGCSSKTVSDSTSKPPVANSKTDSTTNHFPNHPVTLLVQYPAGGGVDVTARLTAKYAEKYLGQQIVVQNVAGGSGVVGVTKVATAKPDGYTLGIALPAIITDKSLLPDVSYTVESFEPIAQINSDVGVLSAKKGGPYDKPFANISAQAKKEKINIGINALWTSNDWSLLQLKKAHNIPLNRVQYQGGAPAVKALLGGETGLSFNYPAEISDFVKQGQIQPIAVTSSERTPVFKDTPTFKELGVNGLEFSFWRILVSPKGIPADVKAKLEEVFTKAFQDPELKKEFEKAGLSYNPKDSKTAQSIIENDTKVYEDLIKKFDLKQGVTP
jgi:tripartite-type tricarboxylate transporter receptor subunit TctC